MTPNPRTDHDTLRTRIAALIEESFADQRRDGGVTLHQSRVLFEHADLPSFVSADVQAALSGAAGSDPEEGWQDIAPAKLNEFSDYLNFLDPPGFHFHLPAFMRLILTEQRADLPLIIWALEPGPAKESFDRFTPAQKNATAAFLWSIARSDGLHADEASAGLAAGWSECMPEFLFAC